VDESDVICSAQCGDLASFNQLVLAYQDRIFNIAAHLLGDDELAADITQEAFISAFRSITSFRGGSFKTWLTRIAVNLCYDELRRRKYRSIVPLEPENSDGEEVDSPYWLADPARLPEQIVEVNELEYAIRYCINILPTDYRSVVILVDVQGFDYMEAALALRVPVGTVKSRLARARLRLRKDLQSFGDILPVAFHKSRMYANE